jgi:hypothetical protein
MNDYSLQCQICEDIKKSQQDMSPPVEVTQHEPFNDRASKLPYGAKSTRQIPVKQNLAKARRYKPSY